MKLIDCSTPKFPNHFVMVDDADFDWLNQWKWHIENSRGKKYGRRSVMRKGNSMHREIMGFPKGKEIDHIDGNGLNNQKENLRICTPLENHKNRVLNKGRKYKGVFLCKRKNRIKRWHTTIIHNHKKIFLGIFLTEIEGALAYNKAAEKLHGEFARLNEVGNA